jgi:SP family arabinose:H+ symporter-like MFS transporter
MRINGYLLRGTVVAALGGLLFGFDTAVIAGTTSGLTIAYHLSQASLGATVASALLGTIFGALLAGNPGDRFGRRDSLGGTAVLYFVSAVGAAFAWNWYALLLCRFIGGLGIGASSVLGPMYVAEISPARLRGRLVGFFQFNVVFGILLAYLSNYLVSLANLGAAEWRWQFGVAAFPSALFLLLLFTIPRSPRWLAEKGRIGEAREVLEKTGEPEYEKALKEIVESIGQQQQQASEPLFQKRHRFPICLAITIAMFNQLAGINAILYYLNDIFAHAGYGKLSSELQAVAIGATNLIFTVIGMAVIDRAGRKILLLIGAVGTAVCLGGIAAIFSTSRHQQFLLWLLVAYIAFFALSQGAVIWVYLSEVFPTRVRAKGQSLGAFTHWTMNALIAWTFPTIAAISGAVPFVFFAVMMVVQFFVVLTLFPETKGLSLEEMQRRLEGGTVEPVS